MMASKFEDKYLQSILATEHVNQKKQSEKDKKEIDTSECKLADFDKIIKKLYADTALGRISDNRFATLLAEFEKEQQELMTKLNTLREKVQSVEENANKAYQFLGFIRKYTDLQELNAKILNELIDKIVVWQWTGKRGKQKVQRVDIYYKFVGIVQGR